LIDSAGVGAVVKLDPMASDGKHVSCETLVNDEATTVIASFTCARTADD